jgi:hypothetical protein
MVKRGALELSIGTVVVLVLGMSMLILGLVLVRSIFQGGTESIDTLNDKIRSEIASLFTNEAQDVVVKLGPDHTAKVKPNNEPFRLAIASRTPDGSATDRERLQYTLTLDESTALNCVKILGLARTKGLFITTLDKAQAFNEYSGANVFTLVEVKVPKGTSACTQKVLVDVKDTSTNQNVGGNFFIVEVMKEGFFS